jgi:predicted alpha-1,6-mannanase (GH76 family)
MKSSFYNRVLFLMCCVVFGSHTVFAQTAGITSGAQYTLTSKASGKLLNVSNASIANGANVDTWTDTKSDAERWVPTFIGNGLYTLTNIGSGKLLHIANATPANSVNVDQNGSASDNTVKWNIVDDGGGYFQLKTAANQNFSLALANGTNANGANVCLMQSTADDVQKWQFTLQTPQAAAPTADIADTIFAAWSTGYNIVNDNGFWGTAEMMEIVLDAYEVTGFAKYRTMFDQMYLNFIKNHGEDWMGNDYNDDITWISIACVRSYLLTGNTTHLNKAKDQFDKMYQRANTHQFGGDGLVWKQGTTGTNSCINGPAMVCCCYLAQALGDTSYYTKAKAIYKWSKLYLFNETTGKVNDNYNGTTIGDWSSTYNQGTYLGASMMLYNRTKDQSYFTIADRIAQYTKVTMYNSGVMNNEESGGDLPGFKGIFMRYARRYIVDGNKPDYIPWLQLNAKVAYNNRNTKSIITTQWATRTGEPAGCTNFSASTAVSLMMNCPKSTIITRDAFATIEAENFDYLRGVIVEKTADASGVNQIGGIQDGMYTAYMNVDFGSSGATGVSFRFSSATAGGTIELRLGGITGTLIGSVKVPTTGDWSAYQTITAPITKTIGLQNLYLVYKGSGYLFNVNYFKFTTGTAAQAATAAQRVHPAMHLNSSGTSLWATVDGTSGGRIVIADLLGRVVYRGESVTPGDHCIDVSNYPRGVYVVSLVGQRDAFRERFVLK